MSTRKITDLPKKSVKSEKAEGVKGGRKSLKSFQGVSGKSKQKSKLGGAVKLGAFIKAR
jgi:hypothetical protein